MAKNEDPKGPTYIEIDGEQFETESVELRGVTYTLRELGVAENDDLEEATRKPDGTYDGRLNLRLSLSKAIVSPPTSADAIAKWPGKKYVILSRVFNRLNSVGDDPKD